MDVLRIRLLLVMLLTADHQTVRPDAVDPEAWIDLPGVTASDVSWEQSLSNTTGNKHHREKGDRGVSDAAMEPTVEVDLDGANGSYTHKDEHYSYGGGEPLIATTEEYQSRDQDIPTGKAKKGDKTPLEEDADPVASSTYTVYGVALPVCEASCMKSCGRSYLIERGNCACHHTCEPLGSCCADYFKHCKKQTADELPKIGNITMESLSDMEQTTILLESHISSSQSAPRARSSCRTLGRVGRAPANLLIIDSCPPGRVEELCQNPDRISRPVDKYTLISKDHLFSNRYCASCNGVFPNDSSVKTVSPSFQCGNSSAEAERILRQKGFAAFERFLLQNCTPEYDFYRVKVAQLFCPQHVEYAQFCDDSLAETLQYFTQINQACNSYRSDVLSYTDNGPVVYRNPHCALCNIGFYNASALTCFLQGEFSPPDSEKVERFSGIGLPSFSILMDFDESYKGVSLQGKNICPGGSYLDFEKNVCVRSMCQPGEVALQGNCTRLQLPSSPSFPRDLRGTYALIFQIFNTSRTEEVAAGYLKVIAENIADPPEIVNITFDAACSVLSSLLHYHGPVTNTTRTGSGLRSGVVCAIITLVSPDVFTSEIFNMVSSLYQESRMSFSFRSPALGEMLAKLAEAGLPSNADSYVRIFKISMVNHLPEALGKPKCPISKWLSYQTSNVTLTEETSDRAEVLSFLRVLWSDTGLVLPVEETPVVLSWRPGRVSLNPWSFSLWTSYCRPNVLTCERVLFEKSDVILEGDWLRIKGYTSRIEQGMFAVAQDGVLICRSAVQKATASKSVSGSETEGWLTLCCITLSLLALAFTLFTYSVFPVLRTVPGVGIMNLSVALFMSQLLFELAPLVAELTPEAVCLVIAALQHYSWLVAFLWMNVLAIDTARTFSNMVASTGQGKSFRSKVYFAYAWGIPGVFVFSCLAVFLADRSSFGYLDLSVCWIQSGRVLFLVFGLPLAMIVLANIGLFVRTVLALREAMTIAGRAKSTIGSSTSTDYAVYIKLFVLMGISWVLGFLAVLTEVHVFKYLFIVVNGLQGVFIAWSFALTARVRKLYREGKFDISIGTKSGTNQRGWSKTFKSAQATSAFSLQSIE